MAGATGATGATGSSGFSVTTTLRSTPGLNDRPVAKVTYPDFVTWSCFKPGATSNRVSEPTLRPIDTPLMKISASAALTVSDRSAGKSGSEAR